MHFNMRREKDDIKQPGAVMLSKIGNNSSALMRQDYTFFDTIKALASYAEASNSAYVVKLVHKLINGIVDAILSFKYVPTEMPVTYLRHIMAAKLFYRHSIALSSRMPEQESQDGKESGHNEFRLICWL